MPIRSWESAAELDSLSDEQWAAVRAAQNGHVLVSAGAGSGKTHTVVATIAWHLGVPIRESVCPDILSLRDIAAITFTNRAAADLKTKLRTALSAVGLRDEAHNLDLARIGTIHAFCGDVLREFALRAGAAPVRTVLDEAEGEALRAEAVRDVILAAAEANDVDGLTALFGEYSVDKVQPWVATLAAERDRVESWLARHGALGPWERALVTLADRASRLLAERLDAERTVDFDRMIVRTRDLVRDNPQVRSVLQRRVRLLIIDEFQDVDPVQQDLARLLGNCHPGQSEGSGEPSRLMLVGDAKQSIYRFRRADVTGWRAIQRDLPTVTISTNYRSTDGILGFVEAAIGPILDRSVTGGPTLSDFEVPFVPLVPAPARETAPRSVEAIVIPACEDGKAHNVDDARRIEAGAVAQRMLEIRAADNRPWGDFAIVLASWGDMDHYESALRRAGIPSYALRMTGFYQRREVIDCLLALRVLLDPADDVAFMGWLRSPFIGVRDDTLLRIATSCAQPYWDGVRDCPIADERERALVHRAVALIERHGALRDRIPTADLLDGLLTESGYLAHLALLGEDGRQPYANLRKLLRQLVDMRDSGVGDALRTIEDARERKDKAVEGDERLFGAQEDVVTITSIHSAKGLEWPVVFWCDLNRGARADNDKLKHLRDQLVLGRADVETKEQSPEWLTLTASIKAEAMAEQKRLWYVAATRAADRLVLSGIPQGKVRKSEGAFAQELVELFPQLCEPGIAALEYQGLGKTFTMTVTTAAVDPGAAAVPAAAIASADTLPPPLATVPAPVGRGRHSATELMLHERCQRRHWFKYIAGIPEPAAHGSGRRRDELVSALTKGQIVHDVLEHLVEEEEIDELLEEAIGRWDPDAPLPDQPRGRKYRELLRRGVEQIAGDPAYRSVADLPGSRRELDFLAVSPTGAVTQGAFDLVGREEEYVLLDVKMGGHGDRTIEERMRGYARQVETYVSVTEAITGGEVGRFVFEFGLDEGPVARTIAADAKVRDAMRESLAVATTALPAGGQELAVSAGTCAACGYRRVGWCSGVSG